MSTTSKVSKSKNQVNMLNQDEVKTENKKMLERTIRKTPDYLGKVQATVEQFGVIRTSEDREKFVATMQKLEKDVPRDIFPEIRREIKVIISRVAIQRNPEKAWKIFEEGYRSTQATIKSIKENGDI